MIKFYYNTAPNPMKVALFLEEAMKFLQVVKRAPWCGVMLHVKCDICAQPTKHGVGDGDRVFAHVTPARIIPGI